MSDVIAVAGLVVGLLSAAVGVDALRRARRTARRIAGLAAAMRRDRAAVLQNIAGSEEDARCSTDGHIRNGACFCLCRKCTAPTAESSRFRKCICDFCNQQCPPDKVLPADLRTGTVELFTPADGTWHHERPVWEK